MAQVRPLPRDPSPGGRVPPHNLEAEESVLGAMLLSRAAVGEALEVVKPGDFYREAHQRICDAVLSLFARGEPADTTTAVAELQRMGALEQVGGMPYIHTLVAGVPSPANAAYYARIVAENATLRRLIDAATLIAQECFEVPESIEDTINRAEEVIYSVAAGRIHEDFRPLRELLGDSMEHIERLASRQSDVTGLPTGFVDLDDLLSGLQPSNLVLVAARPAMGKSSLVVNIAHHVTMHEHLPAVLFSLEMSWMEIVQRLICAEARIDTRKVRTGHMNEADWMKVSHAVGRLAEAPLFVDDTASISIMEIRAKCRRLKQKHGLGLVVVDYIQLMTSARRSENRVQEVSDISRSLKILAKELEVPVVAVSQLSRQPEQQGRGGDRRPRLADLRECVTGDTLVCLADGRRVPICDLVGTEPDVLAVSAEGRMVISTSDKIWKVGGKPVFEVRLASGRSVRATAEHRLFGPTGWIRVRDLIVGSRLATARVLPGPFDPLKWPEGRVILLAHLIGDGSYLTDQPLRYTTGSEENSQAVARAAREEFGSTVSRHPGPGNWHQLVISGNGNRWNPAGLGAWLRELGIWNQRSHEKRVPEPVFRLGDAQVSLFLRHMWATDGTIAVRPPPARGGSHITFSTNSRTLALDVAALLLRLRVHSRIRTTEQRTGRPLFAVTIYGVADQQRFLQVVGTFGPRREQAKRLLAAIDGVRSNTNVDTLPIECFDRVRASMRARGISHREMSALRGTSYGGSSHFHFAPSRLLLAEYAEILEDDALMAHATSDLFWDRVVAVESAGEEDVFDLTVPGPASWLADGIVSHNSGALEQDADVVVFVYRDEVYNPDTPKKGEAEIIVAKHRNGPTETVNLAFLGQYTKFENLART